MIRTQRVCVVVSLVLTLFCLKFEGRLPEAIRHLQELGKSFVTSYGPLPFLVSKKWNSHDQRHFVLAEILYLDSNQFSGPLPGSLLASLLILRELYLYDNLLTGTIPDEIGSPVLFRSIYLDGNQFSGPLPETLRYLRHLGKPKLLGWMVQGVPRRFSRPFLSFFIESLYVFGNQLSGTIPNLAPLKKMSK